MTSPEQRPVFAGVDARREAQRPEWDAQLHPACEPVTFAEAIRALPSATDTGTADGNETEAATPGFGVLSLVGFFAALIGYLRKRWD